MSIKLWGSIMKMRPVIIILITLLTFVVVFLVVADYTEFTLRIGDYFEWVYRWDADGEEDDYEKSNASTSTVWMVHNDIRRYKWVSDATVSCNTSDIGYLSEYNLYVEIDGLSRTKAATNVEGSFSAHESLTMLLKPAPHNMPTPDIELCESSADINGVVSDVP